MKQAAKIRLPNIGVVIAFVASALFCLIALGFDAYSVAVLSKWLPAFLLAVWVWTQRRDAAGKLGSVGLLLSAIADAVLEGAYIAPQSEAPWFVLGLGLFFAAHLSYIATFLNLQQQPRLFPFVAMLVYVTAFLSYLWGDLGPMTIPVCAYVGVIVIMVWRACSLVLPPEFPAIWRTAPIWGALLFAFSDSVIALNKFSLPFDGARFLILITYWVAQLGIAVTVVNWPRRSVV